MIEKDHYAKDEVIARRDAITTRREKIQDASEARKHMLEESRKLQQFERDADELKTWIKEKMKTACDESYKVCVVLYYT